jgi:hypothetical protein
MLSIIDRTLTHLGNPVGLCVYLPFNARGEDHLEDYLGMLGIPFEPTPDFPESGTVFLTHAALKDPQILDKMKSFLSNGNKVIITDGFVRGAYASGLALEQFTSIRDHGRRMSADEYHISTKYHAQEHVRGPRIDFPILEHSNNASWSLLNAGSGNSHASIMLRDPYKTGELITLVLPDLCSDITKLPVPVLNRIRQEVCKDLGIWLEAPAQISLFTYDNDTFGIYSYVGDGCAPAAAFLHIKGSVTQLDEIEGHQHILPYRSDSEETVFRVNTQPGQFRFFKRVN